jgi:cytoskeletal protein RodZ
MDGKATPSRRQVAPELDRIRERKGLTLERMEAETKISRRFLRAIEAGEFEELPGGIFTVSYIRQYARAIDYDEEDLLACYRTRMGGRDPLVGSSIDGQQPERKPFAIGHRLLAILRTGS